MNEPRFEVYPQRWRDIPGGPNEDAGELPEDVTGDFGWRFRAANGKISAIGGEGFTRRDDAHRAICDFSDAFFLAYAAGREDDPNEAPLTLDVDE